MKKVEALKKIAEGLNELIAIEEAAAKVDAPKSEEKPKKETPKADKSAPKKEAPAKKVADDSEGEQEVDLNAMGYAELKAYAADLGLKAIGTKAQLIKKIEKFLAEQGDSEESEEQEEAESAAEETADDSGEDDGEEADGLDDELKAKIDETFEGYTIEELREFVKELGLSTKGSREVLMSKIYDHADEIDFGDDEEGEEESADDDSSEDGEDVSADEAAEDDSEDDSEDEGEEGEEEMTEARAKAVEEWVAEQKQAFDDDELDVKEMKDFLKENFGVTFDKKAKPQEVLDAYIEHGVNFIDDEGNIVEEGVYSVNGEYYCCGTPLEIKKNKKGELSAICAVCGGKYEFDDEDDDE